MERPYARIEVTAKELQLLKEAVVWLSYKKLPSEELELLDTVHQKLLGEQIVVSLVATGNISSLQRRTK